MRNKEDIIKKVRENNKEKVSDANIDNSKKNKNYLLYILLIIIIFLGVFYMFSKNNKNMKTSDSYKFMEEYKELNKDDIKVDISSKNPFVYSNFDQIFDILDNKTGVIYFGFPECPWCRNLVPILDSASKEAGIDKIYYLNCKEDRDIKELKDKKINTIKEGSENYYKLVDKLKDYLGEYKDVSSKLKRLYFPTVVFVKDGKIEDIHIGTLDTQTDPKVSLSKEDQEKLKNILIEKMNKTITCNKIGC